MLLLETNANILDNTSVFVSTKGVLPLSTCIGHLKSCIAIQVHGDWKEDIKQKRNGNNDSYLARLENWEETITTLVSHGVI
jgi:hypothetical protein